MSRTTISLDEKIQAEAKKLGLNVSQICREGLEAAVEAAREAKKAGADFEEVAAWRGSEETPEEVVFTGRYFFTDEDRGNWYYLTPKGKVALVSSDEELHLYDDLGQLAEDNPLAYQLALRALGKVPKPTRLDI